MSVTPEGSLSLPFYKLAELVSYCPTFIAEVEAEDQAEALTFIEYPYRDIEKDGLLLPGAIITDDDQAQQSKNRQQVESGGLFLSFYFLPNPDYADDPKNDLIDFRNKLGAILDEMLERAKNPIPAVDDFFWGAVRWEKSRTPTLVGKPEFDTEFRFAEFLIEWN